MENVQQFLEFDKSWGLNREGAYLKFRLGGEGLIREMGFIERGLNRAFKVYLLKEPSFGRDYRPVL